KMTVSTSPETVELVATSSSSLMYSVAGHGGVFVSPGFAHGGVFVSPANAVPARITLIQKARVSLLRLMGFSLIFEIGLRNADAVTTKLRFMKSRLVFHCLRVALNTSGRRATQGFYHQHRKVGLT